MRTQELGYTTLFFLCFYVVQFFYLKLIEILLITPNGFIYLIFKAFKVNYQNTFSENPRSLHFLFYVFNSANLKLLLGLLLFTAKKQKVKRLNYFLFGIKKRFATVFYTIRKYFYLCKFVLY